MLTMAPMATAEVQAGLLDDVEVLGCSAGSAPIARRRRVGLTAWRRAFWQWRLTRNGFKAATEVDPQLHRRAVTLISDAYRQSNPLTTNISAVFAQPALGSRNA